MRKVHTVRPEKSATVDGLMKQDARLTAVQELILEAQSAIRSQPAKKGRAQDALSRAWTILLDVQQQKLL